jgi:hypothetical protein
MPDKTVQPPPSGRHRQAEPTPDPDQTQRVSEMQALIDQYVDPDGSK